MDLHNVIKIATGSIVVPLAVILNKLWPWWTKQESLPLKIITGLFVLPFTGIVATLVHFWNEY
jgi:hypothetical protein